MKSTTARAKPRKGFYLEDHETHSKLVSSGKKSLIKEALFFLNRPSVHGMEKVEVRMRGRRGRERKN